MTKEASVYCVIVTYNGMRWIQKCLQCLAESDYTVHTLVIDNGSTDDTVAFIQQHFPAVQLTIIKSNLGYGKATNLGMLSALQHGATHILLLNQDAYVNKGSIRELVVAQTANPQYGILSPVQANGNGDDFDGNFYRYLVQSDIHPLLYSAIFNKQTDTAIINTKFVCGAVWLLTKECIEKVGGFDPAFFFYGEDDNYANRTLYHGFKIGILPSAFICHDRNLSFSQFHSNNVFHFRRDSTVLLNRVCDPNQTSYQPFLAKRFLRYGIMSLANMIMFKKEKSQYYFSMTKFIVRNYKRVKTSRQASLHQTMPYLKNELAES